ncbi:Bifunctional 3-dehydroquinate dehydratase/shikimate dehydrogenase [Vigna angularis]|uniref:Bifunctional 3-dehydroquinate dehydratase/shikimate dehydrogenase n=1 Tax=Phaseolus angularis TaxID=3914 RepID=A0A8T0LE40_PHAAN|nr:Bifunctional 3-dehydroquinate dehydratase/shikimate dehydrogenase [Vigna angularis]
MYDGDVNKRLDALRVAMELGADYIDVELQVAHQFYDSIRGKTYNQTRVIVSFHKFKFTPSTEDLSNLVARIQATGTDIVKIATTAVDIVDVARMFQIMVHSQVPLIGLVMGVVSAPGQPSLKDLLHLYNFKALAPDTKVYGLIGKPVSQSKSPMTYSSTNFVGFRRPTDKKLIRYNTYYVGVISVIEDGLRGKHNGSGTTISPLADKLFVVIGVGGAGKAVPYGAKEKGARVVIANRTYDRARELVDAIGGDALSLSDLDNFHSEDGMILANTTSVGMIPKVDERPISKHALKHYSLVFYVVYTPKMTRLLKEAEKAGVTIVKGFEMFLGQAYGQFENFTGLPGSMGLDPSTPGGRPVTKNNVRHFNVIGSDPNGNLGEARWPELREQGRISGACFDAARGIVPGLKVRETDYKTADGTCIRDYIDVTDLVDAHVKALEKAQPAKVGIYNVGTGKGSSVKQFVEACKKATGVDIKVEFLPRRPGDYAEVYSDPRKIKRELDWSAKYTDLQQSLRIAWRWQKSHCDGYGVSNELR